MKYAVEILNEVDRKLGRYEVYNAFIRKCGAKKLEQAVVQNAYRFVCDKLKTCADFQRDYILHEEEDITNMLNIIHMLLREKVASLTALDLTLLLLSVFFHDVGMVADEELIISLKASVHSEPIANGKYNEKLDGDDILNELFGIYESKVSDINSLEETEEGRSRGRFKRIQTRWIFNCRFHQEESRCSLNRYY